MNHTRRGKGTAMTFDKPIEHITPEMLARLVSNGVPESRTLEYKETLPGPSDDDKREFLADVSAFANGIGGDLIYGGREKRDERGDPTGTLDVFLGVEAPNMDQTIQRLENILRDGIAPRVPGVRFSSVGAFECGPVMVVRVPRSWAGPHMLVFRQSGKFFTRHSGGKHQLDVNELRDAFLSSRSASERAEDLRTTRLGRLIAGGAPASLSSDRLLCIHAIPHSAVFGGATVDLQKAAANSAETLRPIQARGWGPRFNIDGVITIAADGGTKTSSYVQVFRTGVVEIVFSQIYFDPPADMPSAIPGVAAQEVATELKGALERTQKLFRLLDISPPVSLFVSLTGMKNVLLHVSRRLGYGGNAFDRDTIVLPEAMLSNYEEPLWSSLRPVLDALWQAAGLERCFDYSEDGQWMPQP
jgi:hypothetical protein